MAKRPRYSRWRRLPRVYRTGEFKLPDSSEPRRVSLYLRDELLDEAEQQAARAGFETMQDYCAELLTRAIETERIRGQVAEVEAKRGPLEGLQEIANDPEYLVEWSTLAETKPEPAPGPSPEPTPEVEIEIAYGSVLESQAPNVPAAAGGTEVGRLEPAPDGGEDVEPRISAAAQVVLQHAGQAGDDPATFLPALRRGSSITINEVAELARALQTLEAETRDAEVLNRRLAFALHRLAYEGQILHTDAWPGVFDAWTVDTLHAVQEAVERILSGQDIRYYSSNH